METDGAGAMVRAINDFGATFHSATGDTAGNAACSPASLAAALTMTWAGAAGLTDVEMRAVLRQGGERDAILARAGDVARALIAPRANVVLRVANGLFAARGYQLPARSAPSSSAPSPPPSSRSPTPAIPRAPARASTAGSASARSSGSAS